MKKLGFLVFSNNKHQKIIVCLIIRISSEKMSNRIISSRNAAAMMCELLT